jgi:hypothetical protein
MIHLPHKATRRSGHNYGATAALLPGTAVPTGASAVTKGAVTELIAATARDAYWLTIIASDYGLSAAASEGCLDIRIGAGSGQMLIPDLLMGYCGGDQATAGTGPKRWDFPLFIPGGSRLTAQAAGARLSVDVQVRAYVRYGPPAFEYGHQVTTYGVTVPDGFPVTPGSSGAEGAWTQIVASTTKDHIAVVPSFQLSGDTALQSRNYQMDVGMGAAQDALDSYEFSTDFNDHLGGPWNSWPTFQNIPSGTSLHARLSASGSLDTGAQVALHCVG